VKWQRPVGPTSLHRIKETLRAILRPAADQGLLTHNVAKLVELPPAVRPKPKLWTPERIAKWRRTGEVPYPVMVWTGDLTGQFLDFTVNHRLYPLFHLIAHTGLRRGEGCGQRRSDTYLDAASLEVANQIVQYGVGDRAEQAQDPVLGRHRGPRPEHRAGAARPPCSSGRG
jgi:integrase